LILRAGGRVGRDARREPVACEHNAATAWQSEALNLIFATKLNIDMFNR
jgi:hypothetical protein